MGKQPIAPTYELETWTSDDEDEPQDEEMDLDCPNIWISKEEKIRISMINTLIIKLLGRTIGYNIRLRKIRDLWRPKAGIDMVAIDNDYFLVKFASIDDYAIGAFHICFNTTNHLSIIWYYGVFKGFNA